LVLRDQISIVIGQLWRLEPKLKNEDIENCPKIMESKTLMFKMMKAGCYCAQMERTNQLGQSTDF
jgi:hypothetical protein